MNERRLYSRIIYQAQIYIFQKDAIWSTKLIDLSLKGALIDVPNQWKSSEEKTYMARVHLHESSIDIEMELTLIQEEQHRLHFVIEHIDIDSASHLKRLIELNVGNDSLLHRELAQLID